jgi:sugar phosphate isomerase/epimerase
MRIALFTDAMGDRPLEEILAWLVADVPEVTEVELGTGGYSSAPHCPLRQLLSDASLRRKWHQVFADRGFRIRALNVSGNPLHPDPDAAHAHDADLRDTIRLAAELHVDRVVAMSGCPGAGPRDRTAPHFSGGGWLPDLERIAEWQWLERVLPYWAEIAAFAAAESPALRICLELHPGTFVYNTSTFSRIAGLSEAIALNLDPSHFFWQSIDPLAVIGVLGARIGHVHGKDTRLNARGLALNGILDNRWPEPADEMPWTFAAVGRGHDADWWSAFLGALAEADFDGTIAIEHEDPFLGPEEGILESAHFLAALMPSSPAPAGAATGRD